MLGAIVVLVTLALLLPPIAQDPQYHLFADQRSWLGVPRVADVLSNLAFVAVGLLRWPLLAVVGSLAPFAVGAAWLRRNR